MGWWGLEIMSGDRPSDLYADLLDIAGVGGNFFDRFEGDEFSKQNLEKIRKKITPDVVDKMIIYLERQENDSYYEDYFIGYQVLAVLLMRFGVPFPDVLRGQAIDCSLAEDWAQQEDARCAVIVSFIDDVLAYVDGTPTELAEAGKGLFDRIAEVLTGEQEVKEDEWKPVTLVPSSAISLVQLRVGLLNVLPPRPRGKLN